MSLWFDVEKKNYTTKFFSFDSSGKLWFDVEKKNYTTATSIHFSRDSCGLM